MGESIANISIDIYFAKCLWWQLWVKFGTCQPRQKPSACGAKPDDSHPF